MKIYVNDANENWICDRLKKEWVNHNKDISVEQPEQADVIWLLAPWQWRQISAQLLKAKCVIITIHHLVPEKWTEQSDLEFRYRDQFVDAYHVPCQQTFDIVRQLTAKPIYKISYWANDQLWFNMPDRKNIRLDLNISPDVFLVGNFQRDTEGKGIPHGIFEPKLEKGPDIFCDLIIEYYNKICPTEVLLAGWRRQYIQKRLKEANIQYHYLESVLTPTVNMLYNALDLYLVTSRYEGGPQAIIECALTRTPIVSTDVGIASGILAPESIFEGDISIVSPNTDVAYENVQRLIMPAPALFYKNMFASALSGNCLEHKNG